MSTHSTKRKKNTTKTNSNIQGNWYTSN